MSGAILKKLTTTARETPPLAENIPSELRERPQWVNWRFDMRDNRPTKIPVNTDTHANASTADEETWGTFDQAIKSFHECSNLAGIGFVFSHNDPYTGVDIDHCVDPSLNKIDQDAINLIHTLNSYTEFSQSRTGTHVICRAKMPEDKGRRKDSVEFYSAGRYFVVTGRPLKGLPTVCEERQPQVDALIAKLFATPNKEIALNQSQTAPVQALTLSDAQLLDKARTAQNGDKFSKLWTGNIADYNNDQSRADAALLSLLRFWTGSDKDRSFYLFGQSALGHRDKWQRTDYRDATWAAIDSGEIYSPAKPTTMRANIEPMAAQAEPQTQVEAGVHAGLDKSDHGGDIIIITRSLTDFADAAIDDTKTLLGKRFVCREGGMLFVGPSGVGKSSASVQQDVLWSHGKPAFGIYPTRPMRITTVQAENDDGDLTEMARGIMGGLQLTPTEREQVRTNTFYVSEKAKTGPAFIRFIESVLRQTKPDIIRLDPLQSYLGGDTSDVESISAFVHTGLNPLLHAYDCACIVNHHTPKTTNRDSSKWRASDWQYAGAGSAVLTNWARAILVVDPCDGNPHLFRFIAAKRGYRVGWQTETGESTVIRYFKHAREDGVIFWTDAQPEEIASGLKAQHSKDDILGLVPADVPISRDSLLSKAQIAGIGVNKTRRFINELVDDGKLHIWRTPRPRTNARIDYARIPQPEPRLNV